MTLASIAVVIALFSASPVHRSSCPAPTPAGPDVAPVSDSWEPRPGVWFPSAAPVTGVTREPGPAHGCELVFHGNAAALWRRPLKPDAGGGLQLFATVGASVGDREGLSWVSLMLTPRRESQGWVTAPEHMMGLLIRSSGAVQVFGGGAERAATWADGPPEPADSYDVALRVTLEESAGEQVLRLTATVGGRAVSAELARGPEVSLPSASHLLVGAHFHPEDPMTSRVGAISGSW